MSEFSPLPAEPILIAPQPVPRPRRQEGVVIWVLPALAVLAFVVVWWQTPARSVAGMVETGRGVKTPTLMHQVNDEIAEKTPKITAKTAVPSVTVSNVPQQKNPTAAAAVDSNFKTLAEIQHALQGDWTGFYQGQRTLSVRADGTATMVAEPEGLAATLLAPKLTFDVRWTVNGENLEFETLSGVPEDAVKIVVRMYGRKRSHKILNLKARKLVLRDEDGVTEYVWNRVSTESQKREAK